MDDVSLSYNLLSLIFNTDVRFRNFVIKQLREIDFDRLTSIVRGVVLDRSISNADRKLCFTYLHCEDKRKFLKAKYRFARFHKIISDSFHNEYRNHILLLAKKGV